MSSTADRTGAEPLSGRLDHAVAQTFDPAGVIAELLTGPQGTRAYEDLLAQHFFVYEALEQAALAMATDPVAGVFVFPALNRVPALLADLAYLMGPSWADRVEAVPATAAYCARLRDVAFDRPDGFVAHQYVRYLTDLSVGRRLATTFDILSGPDGSGGRFYAFDGVDAEAFPGRYRTLLDAVAWEVPEQERFLAEVVEAYGLSRAVLRDLGDRLSWP